MAIGRGPRGSGADTSAAVASTALLTDHYELTMLAGSAARRHRAPALRVRALRPQAARTTAATAWSAAPAGSSRRSPGSGSRTRSSSRSSRPGWWRPEALRWLAGYRFSGHVWGYGEGECYVPGRPLLVVEGTFAEAVVLETLALSILNHDSAVAAAASRMVVAAQGRPCIEMGSRRAHEEAAVACARMAHVTGFSATSNLEAGRRYGVPTVGTSAHAFTLVHDDERAAFEAQIASLGTGTTLLVDTYDVEAGVRTAVEVAGTGLGAVRIDSGDLLEQATAVRSQLDGLGATGTRILVSGDLDEFSVAALAAAPVDAYGIGTSLVTGSGAPTAGLVYKLVAREGAEGALAPVAKKSRDKASTGGRKWPLRRRGSDGIAVAEVLGVGAQPVGDGDDRPLHLPLVEAGEVVGTEPLDSARARHAASLAELPATARQLSRGEPAIPTVYETRA